MTYKLSIRLTNWFIFKGLLKQEDYDVYVYCIDSLLAKIFFYGVLFLVAGWFGILPITIWYYVGFTFFRYTAGGYHAKSQSICTILTWVVYGCSMFIITKSILAKEIWLGVISLSLMIFATMVALRYAPIDHFNKPVSEIKKLQMRRWCIFFQILLILITLLLIWQYEYIYAFSLTLGNCLAAIFLLIAYYQKEEN